MHVLDLIGQGLANAGLLALTARRGARDPMCGMTVDRAKALSATHDGHTVFFCSDHCRRRLRGGARAVTTAPGYVEDKEAILRRLRRIEGQVRGLQRMAEDERDCIDVVTQVAAATTALERVAVELVGDHVRHGVANGEASVEELMGTVERLVRTR